MMKNILILSVGTRNKIIQYFKQNFKYEGKIVCTDMSKFAPALYEGDEFYITPHINERNYISEVLDICKKEKITAALSLVDPELKVLAENKHIFDQNNIKLLQSPLSVIETSFDKYEFYSTLTEIGFQSQRSYVSLNSILNDLESGDLEFPLFAKPNRGSASLNINKVIDKDELEVLFDNYNDLIVQEFIDGKEYGVDVYIDFITREVISIFIKEKIRMKAGETDKSISIKDEKLAQLIQQFVEEMGYVGQIDIDVFVKDNEYYISEVNPRFGGGYPHAYNAGCNFPKYILNNLKDFPNAPDLNNYDEGTVMMKYNELTFMKKEVYEK